VFGDFWGNGPRILAGARHPNVAHATMHAMTQRCATCFTAVGDDTLLSDRGEPICTSCQEKAELHQGAGRAANAIFASSGGALALGALAIFFDPCLVPTLAGVIAGLTTLSLLARHPEHRARLGSRAYVAMSLSVLGMALSIVAPLAGLLFQHAIVQQSAERVAGGPVGEVPAAVERAPDPVREIFATRLPDWVVALDADVAGAPHAAPRDVASTHAAVLGAVDAALPALHEAFASFLADAETFSEGGAEVDDLALTNRLTLLNAALADAHVDYYVDALLLGRGARLRVLASTYAVQRRRRFTSGERIVNGLDLDRIDTLSFEQTLLGYTRPEVRYALVLVRRVEDFLIERSLPSIHSVDESVIVRGYEDEPDAGWVTDFETWVHEDLSREASQIVTQRALLDLSAAVARRRVAVDAMTHALLSSGIRVRSPRTLTWDTDSLAPYAHTAGPAVIGEVRAAQRALDAPESIATYRALEAAHLASIARHEAQHRIDYEDDRIVLHVPAALAVYTGRTESEDRVNDMAERSNAELSAYLSQVAREPDRVLTNLVHVVSFPMSRHDWNRPETYAALVIFETLAQELGISHGDFLVDRRIVRAQIARVYGSIRGHTGTAVAEAAQRGWASLYGVPLPSLDETP